MAGYEAPLRMIVARRQQTAATLIRESTTPWPADDKQGPAPVDAVIERDEIAARAIATRSSAPNKSTPR